MLFKTYGNSSKPVIILIHGGGLSAWMWNRQVEAWEKDYFIITPILDGHGEDYRTPFVSITDTAAKIVRYIDENCGGNVFAIGGLSIGAQIVVEMLSVRKNIAEKAVIESALVIPMKWVASSAKLTYDIAFSWIKMKWFSRLQARSMYIADETFLDYYADSTRMTKESLINMTVSNSLFSLPESLENSGTKALIICGAKELAVMKKSATLLNEILKTSRLAVIESCGHGFSIKSPADYISLVTAFLTE